MPHSELSKYIYTLHDEDKEGIERSNRGGWHSKNFKLSEPNRAGLIVPDNMSENEDITMLVMPVMLNDNA